MPDMGGFQFETMPQDYSYVMPNQGMPNQSFDWSQPSFASMQDFGGAKRQSQPNGFDYQNAQYSTQMPQGWGVANPNGPGLPAQTAGQNQIFQEQQFSPSTGQATGSSGSAQGKSNDDDWKKMLMKMGIGVGVGALGEGAKALFSGSQNQPKQQSSPLPQAPSSAIPQAAPLVPLPGTQASPLISGAPTSVQQSIGLQTQDRMRRGGNTGGLQLY